MTTKIECIYEGEYIRPLQSLDLSPGEHITITIQRKIQIKPIELSHIISDEEVEELREERWASI